MTQTEQTTTPAAPLVVEIDGALMRTTLRGEAVCAEMSHSVLRALRALRDGTVGRDAEGALPDTATLPYRPAVLERIAQARAEGRDVILFGACAPALAARIGAHLGLETPTEAGPGAAQALAARLPAGYEVIARARTGPLAQHAARILTVAELDGATARSGGTVARALLRELRPHQWVKNLLVFLPLVAAQHPGWAALWPTVIAALAFCGGASTIYIVNDLLDLDADRLHPEKRNRPLASGRLPIRLALPVSPVLGVASLALAAVAGPLVALGLALYMALSLAYSLRLKALRWIDLGVLTALYVLRVVTGALAAGITLSAWLGGFVCAVFLALAAVKRLTELARHGGPGRLPGRGYSAADLPVLTRIAMAGVAGTVLTFLAYTFSAAAAAQYANLWILRLATLAMAGWLIRMIRLSLAGKEDYDPILFVAHDRPGQAIMLGGLTLFLLAL